MAEPTATHQLTPYLCVSDSRAAIAWYREVLGAEVTYEPIVMDDGKVGHCELAVGGARWMMSDEFDGAGVAAPSPGRGAAVSLHLAVPTAADVDRLAAAVTVSGADLARGPEDSPPAGRVAVFTDPFGHRWFVDGPLADASADPPVG